MKMEEMNEVKAQLWSHLQYLIGRIEEVQSVWYTVKKWNWLGDQYRFCKSEIMFWKELTS